MGEVARPVEQGTGLPGPPGAAVGPLPAGPAPGSPETPWLAERALHYAYRWRLLLVLAAIVFYFCGFNGRWRFTPDTGKYLVVARNLAEGRGYTHPGGFDVRASPGLPWLEAASMRLFHGEVWPVVLLMVLLGLGGLWLAYRLFKRRLPPGEAVIAWVMLTVCEVWYVATHRLLADLPFALGALLFLLAWERAATRRDRAWATAAMFVLGVVTMALFRSVVLTFLVGVSVAAVVHAVRQRTWKPIAVGAAGAAALVALVFLVDPRVPKEGAFAGDEASAVAMLLDRPGEVLHRAVTEHVPHLMTERMSEAVLGVDSDPIISVMVALVVLGLGVHLFRERLLWGCVFFAFIGQWLLYGVTERYFLPVLPLIVFAWWRMTMWLATRTPRPWGNAVWLLLLVIWLVPNAIHAGDVARDALRHLDERPAAERGVFELAGQMDERLPADAVVLAHDGSIADPLAFLSRRNVIVPSPRDFGRLRGLIPGDPSTLYVLLPTEDNVQSLLFRFRARLSAPVAKGTRGEGEQPWTLHRIEPRRAAVD